MGCNASSPESNHVRTITIVGLEGSGKSNITFHLVATNATNYVPLPTPGVDFHELQLNSSTFYIYDCGGISRYRTQWPYYISMSDGVVFVIDRTDKERMGRVQEEIANVLEQCQEMQIPLLILINKSDVTTSLTTEDFLKITKADMYDVEYEIKECSAKTGDGIQEGRDWLLQHIHPRNSAKTSGRNSKASNMEKSENQNEQSQSKKSHASKDNNRNSKVHSRGASRAQNDSKAQSRGPSKAENDSQEHSLQDLSQDDSEASSSN